MLKEEITEKISKYFKLTSYEAEKIYDDIFSIIISGVKQDNFVDVANFGEFIIKYNEGNGDQESSGYKKTAEFLATSRLEEEINQGSYERSLNTFHEKNDDTCLDDLTVQENKVEEQPEVPEIHDMNIQSSVFVPPVTSTAEEKEQVIPEPVITQTEVYAEKPADEQILFSEHLDGENPVEEEMRRKREQILSKLTKPLVETKPLDVTKPYVPLLKLPQNEGSQPAFTGENTETVITKTSSVVPDAVDLETPEVEHVEAEQIIPEHIIPETMDSKSIQEFDDFSHKSFSDFFTEVNPEETEKTEQIPAGEYQNQTQNVIPPSVVELHNEITNTAPAETHHEIVFPTTEVPKTPVSINGSGNGLAAGEYRASDNSYYIWYKDIEANAADTQNLSFEYELLYQAAKEAEYKSKLKIYVTTFIIFFSIVLVLLIFSPVIYKVFFKPIEGPSTENVNQQQVTEQQAPDNKATQNVLPQNNTQQQPVEQKTEQTQTPQQQKQEQPPQQQTQNTEPKLEGKLEGLAKSSAGWQDSKFNVLYLKLDNGKYAMQESSWDTEQKAKERISKVTNYKIGGMTGSVVKADLAGKGTWYRTRFGEFTTLEEARSKAEELRSKEKTKP